MSSPPSTWSEPLHQTALRTLARVGGVPFLLAPDESHWMLDASRSAVLLFVKSQDRSTLEAQFRDRLKRFPQGGVDLVVVGGDVSLTETIQSSLPTYSTASIGALHVSDDGVVWAHAAVGALEKAMRVAFANGVPAAVDPELVASEMAAAEHAGRARIEALQAFARSVRTGTPYGTIALIAAIVVIFGLEYVFGHASTPTLVRMGACMSDRVKQGEWWRLLASSLLHANIAHLFFNGISLLSLGAFYERLLGTGRFFVLFVVAALFGAVSTVIFTPNAVMVGASGGVFGMLGAAGALAIRPGNLLPRDYLPAFRKNIVMNLVLQIAFSTQPNISLAAHLGGGLAGFVLMFTGAIAPRNDATGHRSSWRIQAGIALALLAASFGVAMLRGSPWKGSEWSRRVLPGTTFSADFPAEIHVHPRGDGVREYQSGSLADDGATIVVMVATIEPHETPESRAAIAEEIRAGGSGLPATAQNVGSAAVTDVGGFPVVTQDARFPNGIQIRDWRQVRRDAVVYVHVYMTPEAAAQQQDDPQRILSSLRGDQ